MSVMAPYYEKVAARGVAKAKKVRKAIGFATKMEIMKGIEGGQ
jgi:hypothetical protein